MTMRVKFRRWQALTLLGVCLGALLTPIAAACACGHHETPIEPVAVAPDESLPPCHRAPTPEEPQRDHSHGRFATHHESDCGCLHAHEPIEGLGAELALTVNPPQLIPLYIPEPVLLPRPESISASCQSGTSGLTGIFGDAANLPLRC